MIHIYESYLVVLAVLVLSVSFGVVDFELEGFFVGGVTLPIPNIFDDKRSHSLDNLDLNDHTLGSVLKISLQVYAA